MNYFIARRHNPMCVSNDKDYFDAIKLVLFLHTRLTIWHFLWH